MVCLNWLEAALAYCNDGIVVAERLEAGTRVVFANESFQRISGYELADLQREGVDLLYRAGRFLDHPFDLDCAIAKGQECSVRFRCFAKAGHSCWFELKIAFHRQNDRITHVVFVYRDITQEVHTLNVLDKVSLLYREMCKRLEYANEVDPLTQLKSRNHLSTRGEFVLGAAKRQKLRLHAIFIAIDNLKHFSALGGPEFGDQCLIGVANLINTYFSRATDIAIRMCDDEFVVLCLDDEDERVIERTERFRQCAHSTVLKDHKRRPYKVSISVGVYSVTPEKYTTIEEILDNASRLVLERGQAERGVITHRRADEPVSPRSH